MCITEEKARQIAKYKRKGLSDEIISKKENIEISKVKKIETTDIIKDEELNNLKEEVVVNNIIKRSHIYALKRVQGLYGTKYIYNIPDIMLAATIRKFNELYEEYKKGNYIYYKYPGSCPEQNTVSRTPQNIGKNIENNTGGI